MLALKIGWGRFNLSANANSPQRLYSRAAPAQGDMSHDFKHPPHDRCAVETIVTEYDEKTIIRDAIQRE